jgi:hypothetical protein
MPFVSGALSALRAPSNLVVEQASILASVDLIITIVACVAAVVAVPLIAYTAGYQRACEAAKADMADMKAALEAHALDPPLPKDETEALIYLRKGRAYSGMAATRAYAEYSLLPPDKRVSKAGARLAYIDHALECSDTFLGGAELTLNGQKTISLSDPEIHSIAVELSRRVAWFESLPPPGAPVPSQSAEEPTKH